MTAESDDYENGVADVLRAVVAGSMQVSVRQHLRAFDSGGVREIDVVARGPIPGAVDGLLVVDCKRYSRSIDVNDAGKFVALVKDVRADLGLLVSSSEFSAKALQLIRNERGIRCATLALAELERFAPRGTRRWVIEVPDASVTASMRQLRKAGFRTWIGGEGLEPRSGGTLISVIHHPGAADPDADVGSRAHEEVMGLLDLSAPGHDLRIDGVVMGGGLPGSRWLDVTLDGAEIGLRVLASNEGELAEQLAQVADIYGMAINRLGATRPADWPLPPFLEWIGRGDGR